MAQKPQVYKDDECLKWLQDHAQSQSKTLGIWQFRDATVRFVPGKHIEMANIWMREYEIDVLSTEW